jgi:hypothetical protein
LISPVIPPDTAAAGQTGHVQAHDQISDALTAIVGAVNALPAMSWGKATLVGGTVAVTLPAVDSASVILVSRMTPSGTLGRLAVPTVSPGSGFTITSDSAGENSVVGWAVLG